MGLGSFFQLRIEFQEVLLRLVLVHAPEAATAQREQQAAEVLAVDQATPVLRERDALEVVLAVEDAAAAELPEPLELEGLRVADLHDRREDLLPCFQEERVADNLTHLKRGLLRGVLLALRVDDERVPVLVLLDVSDHPEHEISRRIDLHGGHYLAPEARHLWL